MNAAASDLVMGLGWLTCLWPTFAHAFVIINLLSELLGERSLTSWLFVTCVDLPRRHGRAATNH